jgi:uncharacterized membrane protein (UPF0182 family)
MPAGLRKHVRYPELLFKLQAEVYGLYHMTNPEVFFNREDLWTVATENGMGNDGDQVKQAMQPNFVLMKLPGEAAEEFVEILPFTPANRNNLIGWIAGRCDGDDYGNAVVYDFPKTRLVDGPQQIEARIDQNAQLSGQLTLWNQQGSHVLRGSLLVIPTGKALLTASPGQPNPPQPNQPAATTQSLIAEASRDFADYQRLTAAGKLAEAGQKLDALHHTLDQLNANHH